MANIKKTVKRVDEEKVLEVRNLKTFFHTKQGTVKAVNGVNYSIGAGKTLAIVGESGSGKSVTSLSMLKLIDEPGKIEEGSILIRNNDVDVDSKEIMELSALRDNAFNEIKDYDVKSVCERIEDEEIYSLIARLKRNKARIKSLVNYAKKEFSFMKLIIAQDRIYRLSKATTPEDKIKIKERASERLESEKAEFEKTMNKQIEPLKNEIEKISEQLKSTKAEVKTKVAKVKATFAKKQADENKIIADYNDELNALESSKAKNEKILANADAAKTEKDTAKKEISEASKKIDKILSEREVKTARYISSEGTKVLISKNRDIMDRALKDAAKIARRHHVIAAKRGLISNLAKAVKMKKEIEVVTADTELMQHVRGNIISMIFQEPMTALNPVLSIGNQMSESYILHQGLNKKESIEKSIKMLDSVGIPNPEGVVKRYPHQLSGGMKQRVMIAMALACKPKVLIADEPTTALDVTIQAQILKLMNQLKKDNGTAILFITHDLGVVAQVADEVVVMYAGQATEQAPVASIYSNSKYSHPYRYELLKSIPKIDGNVQRLEVIEGEVPHPLQLPKGCKFAPRCIYATKKCETSEPTIKEYEKGHWVSCFYPETSKRKATRKRG